jgi:hypothetical protein
MVKAVQIPSSAPPALPQGRRQWSPHDRSAAPFPRAGKMPQTPRSSNTFCDSPIASLPQTERRPGCGTGPSKAGVLGNTPMGSGWVPQHIGAGRSRRNAKNAYLNAVALERNRSTHAIPHILQDRRCTRNKRVAMMEVATRLLPRTPQAPRSEGLCQACAKTPRVVNQGSSARFRPSAGRC